MTKKNFKETNDSKSTVSKVVKGTSPSKIRGKFFKIKVYIGIAISLLVVAILASIFLFSPNAKKESNEAISSVAKKENTSKEAIDTSKASENEKKKEEEIQKLKEQLASLDSKIAESEKLVDKLKEETAVPKLDIEALRNNDLSSLKGTWRSLSSAWLLLSVIFPSSPGCMTTPLGTATTTNPPAIESFTQALREAVSGLRLS